MVINLRFSFFLTTNRELLTLSHYKSLILQVLVTYTLKQIYCSRSQGGSNLSFPNVLGGNPHFFRPMNTRLKHSGMTAAII